MAFGPHAQRASPANLYRKGTDVDTSKLPRQPKALSSASASLILDNRELLWYPIASGIFALIVTRGYAFTLGRVLEAGWAAVLGQLAITILASLAFVLSTAALATEAGLRFEGNFSNAGIGIDVALDRFPVLAPVAVIFGGSQVAFLAIANRTIAVALATALLIVECVGFGVALPIIVTETGDLAGAVRRGAELLRAAWRDLVYGAVRYIVGVVLALVGLIAAGFAAIFILSEVAGRGITTLLMLGIGLAFVIAVAFLTAQWMAFCVAVYRLRSGQPIRGYDPGVALSPDRQ